MPNKAFIFSSPFVENVNILFVKVYNTIHCARLDLGIGTKRPSVVKSVCLLSAWIPSSHGLPVLNFFAGAARGRKAAVVCGFTAVGSLIAYEQAVTALWLWRFSLEVRSTL